MIKYVPRRQDEGQTGGGELRQDIAVPGQTSDGKDLTMTACEEAERGVRWRDACVWTEPGN